MLTYGRIEAEWGRFTRRRMAVLDAPSAEQKGPAFLAQRLAGGSNLGIALYGTLTRLLSSDRLRFSTKVRNTAFSPRGSAIAPHRHVGKRSKQKDMQAACQARVKYTAKSCATNPSSLSGVNIQSGSSETSNSLPVPAPLETCNSCEVSSLHHYEDKASVASPHRNDSDGVHGCLVSP